ncbi:unnamed protein product (macronuclear) [Paramecium tetraurelia]|uniref:Spindle assembly abnormal protein 6 N-terminal domain-containing protein n=1 Tax=Paramecium tetraurelia TaxID=5888 RepID=A0CM72_PARTE|nr:uncharacterized protein GSPATT00008368001 [Paramecium tetraurelia]CAK71889.1 unnamed protein product [Paramecium tetraurelia]|eukprot:XP_001439286.1 hypothetical protein (macronuclear) [Paramecium tetraurelia strain d4-2]
MLDNPKIQLKTELTLLGMEYLINIQANDHLLYIELESKYAPQIWKNTYTIDYIEELTRKTGNQKKFNVFLSMLQTAIQKTNENIFFEILTYQDLENLKQQKQQNQSHISRTSSTNSKINKRYLILSYKNDLEKVHYPLALNYEEHIENSRLMTKIQNLKTELLEHKSQKQNDSEFQVSNLISISKRDNQTFDSLVNQNELLKAKAKRLEEALTQKKGAVEVDQLIRDNEDLQNLLNTSKLLYEEKIQKLEQQIDLKSTEIVLQMSEINAFKKELSRLIGQVEMDNHIKEKIKLMNEDEESKLVKAQKTIQKYEKEVEALIQQIDSLKKQDAVQKRKINQLETELSQSMKRFSYKGVTDRLYSSYSNHSNASKKSNYSVPKRENSNNSSRNASPNVRQTSPILNKNSHSSVQNSSANQRPKFYNTSPMNKQPIQKKSSPARPQQQIKPNPIRTSPITQQKPSPGRNNIFKQPSPPRQYNQQHRVSQLQQTKQRTNQSANNYKQPIKQVHQYDWKSGNVTELDNKINNLKNILSKAKR